MEQHAVGILSALAAAVFAGSCRPGRAYALGLGLAFLAAAALVTRFVPAAPAMAAVIGAAAALGLARPQWAWVAPLGGAAAGAGWVSVLVGQGLPFAAALPVAGGTLAAGAWLAARRPGFAPAAVRDESLLLIGVYALVVAVGADLAAGWRSAVVLTSEPLAGDSAVGTGLAALVVACVVLGGMYALWKR